MSFNKSIAQQAWMIAPDTVRVMEALDAQKDMARFVGGCVRDSLVNRDVIDIDIATPYKPDEVIEKLKAAKINYVPTGLKHGTVTAIVDGKPFEITTLRIDVNHFGRHADVAFTDDWGKDAARRDFTINAMSANMDGQIFDPYNGVEHLRTGSVVFVGEPEERIREDILRILRYFRCYAHFGQGVPDANALKACAKMASQLHRLSGERIRRETFKLLESDRCGLVWKIMLRASVVTHFLPEATNADALMRLVTLEQGQQNKAYILRRLAALLDVTRDGLISVAKALKLSNEQAYTLSTLALPVQPVDMNMLDHEVKQLVYRTDNDTARSLLLLSSARTGNKEGLERLYQLATSFKPPRFPVIGDDVIKLGWKQGPEVGKILNELSEWWMMKDFVPGRTECLQKLQDDYGSPAPSPEKKGTPVWITGGRKE
jgi:poly(A) polymerase